ncbi:MAG: four helix bundle protein, partial [Planctomycetes bacterium]|nr:four helix bundle protein [Planctomycetota bacterium]
SKHSSARKEARETLYWLRLLTAAKSVSEDRLNNLMGECNEIIAILTTIIKKTRAKHE